MVTKKGEAGFSVRCRENCDMSQARAVLGVLAPDLCRAFHRRFDVRQKFGPRRLSFLFQMRLQARAKADCVSDGVQNLVYRLPRDPLIGESAGNERCTGVSLENVSGTVRFAVSVDPRSSSKLRYWFGNLITWVTSPQGLSTFSAGASVTAMLSRLVGSDYRRSAAVGAAAALCH